MNTDEILEQLSVEQHKELAEKLQAAAAMMDNDYKKNPAKYATVTTSVQLRGYTALEVTFSLLLGDKNKLHPVIEEIVKR